MAGDVVTIFGGSGFIGRHLVRRLADRGWTIRVAVRHPSSAHFLKPLGNVGQIVPVRAPLQDEVAVQQAVTGVQAVVNLVGVLAESGAQTFTAVHARGASLIATAATEAGVERLAHVSALGADRYAAAQYLRTKGAGEAAVRTGFPGATIFRPSIVFGPEDSFFNRFAAMARLAPALPLIGGGKTRFQPVYVGDVADAIATCLGDVDCAGKTYELGGPKTYTFKALMELMLREIGRKRLLLPIPFAVAEVQGAVLQHFPGAPLTRDQVLMLRRDNVVSEEALGFADLGIRPTSVEVIIPTYLQRYRRGGRFSGNLPV